MDRGVPGFASADVHLNFGKVLTAFPLLAQGAKAG